jgi:hypothetical protein
MILDRIWPWSRFRELELEADISFAALSRATNQALILQIAKSEAKRKEIETKRRNRMAKDPILAAEIHGDMA